MELKTALILLLLAAVGWLGYDDYAKRRLLENAPKRPENVADRQDRITAAPAPVPARAHRRWSSLLLSHPCWLRAPLLRHGFRNVCASDQVLIRQRSADLRRLPT